MGGGRGRGGAANALLRLPRQQPRMMPPAADYALTLHAGSGLLLDESRRVCPCVLLPLRASLALVGRAGGGGDDEDVDMGGDYLQGVEIIDSSYGMIEQSISSTGHYSLAYAERWFVAENVHNEELESGMSSRDLNCHLLHTTQHGFLWCHMGALIRLPASQMC
ncbi:uncharacterized protein [Miscanthus floridulus]|uniref:uncharacterized protein n=1 Tax=Miscanthus floridulus TaxID=154761 RepID=UPI00345B2274